MLARPLSLIVWLCLVTSPAFAQASAGEHFADANGALGVAKGPAAAVIQAELARLNQDCTGMDFKPRRCAMADNALNADVHYGTLDASGRHIAFVSVRGQSDPTGNAVEAKGLVFIAEAGQAFRLLGTADLMGDAVADVRFESGRITYATDYRHPNDARAPIGRRRYELALRPDGIGPVAIQRTGFGSTPSAHDLADLRCSQDKVRPAANNVHDDRRRLVAPPVLLLEHRSIGQNDVHSSMNPVQMFSHQGVSSGRWSQRAGVNMWG